MTRVVMHWCKSSFRQTSVRHGQGPVRRDHAEMSRLVLSRKRGLITVSHSSGVQTRVSTNSASLGVKVRPERCLVCSPSEESLNGSHRMPVINASQCPSSTKYWAMRAVVICNWQRLESSLVAADENLRQLIARTNLIPGDFRTASRELEARKASAQDEVKQLRLEISALETRAQGIRTGLEKGPFALFGDDHSSLVQLILLILLGIGHEANAAALLYRPNSFVAPPMRPQRDALVTRVLASAIRPSAEHYLRAAREHSRYRKLAGYRVVSMALGISETAVRGLLRECIELGWIGRDRRIVSTASVDTHS